MCIVLLFRRRTYFSGEEQLRFGSVPSFLPFLTGPGEGRKRPSDETPGNPLGRRPGVPPVPPRRRPAPTAPTGAGGGPPGRNRPGPGRRRRQCQRSPRRRSGWSPGGRQRPRGRCTPGRHTCERGGGKRGTFWEPAREKPARRAVVGAEVRRAVPLAPAALVAVAAAAGTATAAAALGFLALSSVSAGATRKNCSRNSMARMRRRCCRFPVGAQRQWHSPGGARRCSPGRCLAPKSFPVVRSTFCRERRRGRFLCEGMRKKETNPWWQELVWCR